MARRRYFPVEVRRRPGTEPDFNIVGVDFYYDQWEFGETVTIDHVFAFTDAFEFGDSVSWEFPLNFSDAFEFGDSSTWGVALNWEPTDAVELGDSVSYAVGMSFTDAFEFGDSASYVETLRFTDAFEFGNSATWGISLTWAATDAFEFGDNADDQLSNAKFLFNTFDGACYSMNEFGAISEYSGWEFESFATVNGTVYAVNLSGLSTIGGADQAGTDIDCSVRTGLTNFNAGRLVGMGDVIVMADSADETVGKVREMKNGSLIEHWYQSDTANHGGPREYRLKPGMGIRGSLLAIEVGNKNGADWSLDQVQVYPVVLDKRRIS